MIPVVFTFINIYNLFLKDAVKPFLVEGLTLILGLVFTLILYDYLTLKDYNEPLYVGAMYYEIHAPVASLCSTLHGKCQRFFLMFHHLSTYKTLNIHFSKNRNIRATLVIVHYSWQAKVLH
jgi:hypothetical protein